MENMKFRIDSPAQSEALQNVLFSLGYGWDWWSDKKTVHEFLDMPYLWASYEDMSISYATKNSSSFFTNHPAKEQNTAEFITRHTKANKMENTTELEFDINADISRQYTRDGRKIVFLQDTGLDIVYPISAAIDGENQAYSFTKLGQYYEDEEGAKNESHYDIITRTEVKPLIVDYLNVYRTEGIIANHPSAAKAVSAAGGVSDHLAVIKLTYNPNDGSVAAEIVKQ